MPPHFLEIKKGLSNCPISMKITCQNYPRFAPPPPMTVSSRPLATPLNVSTVDINVLPTICDSPLRINELMLIVNVIALQRELLERNGNECGVFSTMIVLCFTSRTKEMQHQREI